MTDQLPAISEKFSILGALRNIELIKAGHIHDSYLVKTTKSKYFLQRINHQVFRNVVHLMQNIERVTSYLTLSGEYETLEIVYTKESGLFYQENGSFWRMYHFKEGYKSYDIAPSNEFIFEAAKAFGEFSDRLSSFHKPLNYTISGFHSLKYRMKQLNEVSKDSPRYSESKELIRKVSFLQKELLRLEEAWESGEIPTRITHNDTKINNVLFDDSGNAKCIVDLDTVMPGIIHFDIGDGIRTTCTSVSEDEENIEMVQPDRSRYLSFINGYLDGFKSIKPSEKDFLNLSGPYMALIMGVRFLNDYLSGDEYFQVKYPEQNFYRARVQILLAEKLYSEKF